MPLIIEAKILSGTAWHTTRTKSQFKLNVSTTLIFCWQFKDLKKVLRFSFFSTA